jgi:hypothetical protein
MGRGERASENLGGKKYVFKSGEIFEEMKSLEDKPDARGACEMPFIEQLEASQNVQERCFSLSRSSGDGHRLSRGNRE